MWCCGCVGDEESKLLYQSILFSSSRPRSKRMEAIVVLGSQVVLFVAFWLVQSPASAFIVHTSNISAVTNKAHSTATLLRRSSSLTTLLQEQQQSSPFPAERTGDNNINDRLSTRTRPPAMPTPLWFQHAFTVTSPSRGCHLITSDILKATGSDIRAIEMGLCHVFIQHTSASLTINENADADVRTDMETALNRLVPATWNRDGTFRHTLEGDDDMPGHVKSSLMGVSLTIPIRNGKLALGTWQGIYLNEHRDQGGWGGAHQRSIIVTLQGVGNL